MTCESVHGPSTIHNFRVWKGCSGEDSSRHTSCKRASTHLDIVHGKRAGPDVGSRSQGVVDPQRHGAGQLVVVEDAPVLIMILHMRGKVLGQILGVCSDE
jgi:hypothetical protein